MKQSLISTELKDSQKNRKQQNIITDKALRSTLNRVVSQKKKENSPNGLSYPEADRKQSLGSYFDLTTTTIQSCLIVHIYLQVGGC